MRKIFPVSLYNFALSAISPGVGAGIGPTTLTYDLIGNTTATATCTLSASNSVESVTGTSVGPGIKSGPLNPVKL